MSWKIKKRLTPNIDNSEYSGDKCFSSLIAICLFLGVYLLPSYPSVSFADVFLIFFFLILIIKYHRLTLFHSSELYLFIFYSLLASLIIGIINNVPSMDTLTRLLRDGFYYICIFAFAYSYLDYKIFEKWVYRICFLLSIYVILQQVLYIFTGYYLPGMFMNATVTQSSTPMDIYQSTLVSAHRNGYLKANGFLLEGAHVAQALSICFVVIFDFEQTDKKSIYRGLFLSVATILTFAASAVFYIAFIWLYVLIYMMRSEKINKKMGSFVILFLLVIVFISAFFVSNGLGSVMGRLFSASSISTADHSSYMRLYKGYDFWSNIPLLYKLFGIGFGNYLSMTHLYGGLNIDIMGSEYMNSLSYILISSGIFGTSLLFLMFYKMYRTSNKRGKIACILLFLFCISSSVYSSIYWIWLVVIIIFNSRTYVPTSTRNHIDKAER